MARTKEFDQAQVLSRAVELFWRKGCQGTSMQELVDYLGISRSSLYDTYGDKQRLFMAALEQYRREMSGTTLALLESATEVKPTLRRLLETAAQPVASAQANGCLMVNTAVEAPLLEPEVVRVVEENRQAMEAALARLIARGQADGEISSRHDAAALGRFFFNTVTGIQVAARAQADPRSLEDIIAVSLSVLD